MRSILPTLFGRWQQQCSLWLSVKTVSTGCENRQLLRAPLQVKYKYCQYCNAQLQLYLHANWHTHTHTHPFNGPFSGTTQVSQYQKGRTNLDFTEARDSEWQRHQLGQMQVCTLLQTNNHTSIPPLTQTEAITNITIWPWCNSSQLTLGKHTMDIAYDWSEIR